MLCLRGLQVCLYVRDAVPLRGVVSRWQGMDVLLGNRAGCIVSILSSLLPSCDSLSSSWSTQFNAGFPAVVGALGMLPALPLAAGIAKGNQALHECCGSCCLWQCLRARGYQEIDE